MIALFLILPFLAPPRPLVVTGPPQKVGTAHPIVGVHTRLTDEVDEWKVQRSLQMVREMGAPWIVEFFPWAYYEPAPGHHDWSHADLGALVRYEHRLRPRLTLFAGLSRSVRPADATERFLASNSGRPAVMPSARSDARLLMADSTIRRQRSYFCSR